VGGAAGQPVGQGGGAVAGVEDEQRHRPAGVTGGAQAAQHVLDLGDRLRGPGGRGGPLHVDGRCPGGPQVAGDGGELVLPPGRGLAGALAVAGPVVDVLPARGAPRVRPGIGRRVHRDPHPPPAGARVPDPGGVRRWHPGQGPVQQPAVGDVMLRDPGTALRPVHQRRQYLREQGEQPLVIDPPGRQRIVERAVPATELRFQGQLHQGPHRAIGAQDGVRQLEQRVRPRRQAPQQLLPELPQRAERRVPRKDQQPGTRA
jgi:hypothetical protein